jgi:hypothetical protein
MMSRLGGLYYNYLAGLWPACSPDLNRLYFTEDCHG